MNNSAIADWERAVGSTIPLFVTGKEQFKRFSVYVYVASHMLLWLAGESQEGRKNLEEGRFEGATEAAQEG